MLLAILSWFYLGIGALGPNAPLAEGCAFILLRGSGLLAVQVLVVAGQASQHQRSHPLTQLQGCLYGNAPVTCWFTRHSTLCPAVHCIKSIPQEVYMLHTIGKHRNMHITVRSYENWDIELTIAITVAITMSVFCFLVGRRWRRWSTRRKSAMRKKKWTRLSRWISWRRRSSSSPDSLGCYYRSTPIIHTYSTWIRICCSNCRCLCYLKIESYHICTYLIVLGGWCT